VRTKPEPSVAEDAVANRELIHCRADCHHLTCKLGAEDPLPGPAEARDEATEDFEKQATTSVGFTSVNIQPVDRRSVDLDEDLVILRDGSCDIFDS
jgi:hypothetical protein